MTKTGVIFRRELNAYFATPIAIVFLIIFVFLSSALTFYWGGFFARNQADLLPFFTLLPWLLLLLMPALGMRLWSEEYSSGTVSLLTSLPFTTQQLVLGKFFAAWSYTGFCFIFTSPLWITVNYLGSPDNGVIFASYIGSLLVAGSMLAMSSCISALSKNQVMAFMISTVVCLCFMLSGTPFVIGYFKSWAPSVLVDTISHLSILHHTQQINKGIIDVRDIYYFGSLIVLWLFMNILFVEYKKNN